jgi:RNA polymerase sigma-70 factor, ECF subfamily
MANVDASNSDDDFLQEASSIDALKCRSSDAWMSLFDQNYERIRRLAWGKLRSNPDADDVAATVFLRALNAIDSYQYRGTPIIAWLYSIARNVIKERQRALFRDRGNETLDDEVPLPACTGDWQDDDPEMLIRRLDLLDAFHKLTPDQQKVITLVYVAGFSVREVARILGKGERAVYYMQARGLVALRQELSR